jgi:hypothetical protein
MFGLFLQPSLEFQYFCVAFILCIWHSHTLTHTRAHAFRMLRDMWRNRPRLGSATSTGTGGSSTTSSTGGMFQHRQLLWANSPRTAAPRNALSPTSPLVVVKNAAASGNQQHSSGMAATHHRYTKLKWPQAPMQVQPLPSANQHTGLLSRAWLVLKSAWHPMKRALSSTITWARMHRTPLLALVLSSSFAAMLLLLYVLRRRRAAQQQLRDFQNARIVAPQYYDVCVIGAGPAGASCAWHIATGSSRSIKVLLLDRCSLPRDKICGDVLSPQVQRQLWSMQILQDIIAQGSGRWVCATRAHHTLDILQWWARSVLTSVRMVIDSDDSDDGQDLNRWICWTSRSIVHC